MNKLTAGSFRLFRVAGIQVYLHWSWLLVAYFELVNRVNPYQSTTWNVVEYVSLFGIVLAHEFGHALACRQVGGQADKIMLWPLGGVAFVQPPPRPGAVLWSIAAGPLVNVLLLPVTLGAILLSARMGLSQQDPDLARYLWSMGAINFGLLFFNMLPVYPLDGGQILQALLWFVIGRARSLMVSGIIGLVVAGGAIVLALVRLQDRWLALVAAFVAWQAWRGFQMGSKLQRLQPTLDLLNEAAAAARKGNDTEAVDRYTQVIAAGGDDNVLALALTNRGALNSKHARWQSALDDYAEAIRRKPDLASAHNNLAWLLAACPVDALRNGPSALEHAGFAYKAAGATNPSFMGTLAAACAETGDFDRAIEWQNRALADPAYAKAFGQAAADRLSLYGQRLPYRLPADGGQARAEPSRGS